jgi:hypothetical protein
MLSSSGSVFFALQLQNLFFSSFSVFFGSPFSCRLPLRPGTLKRWGLDLMKPETRRCKCLNCNQLFVPDYRNRDRQKYCSAPECKQASKRARQQAWLSKPENRD